MIAVEGGDHKKSLNEDFMEEFTYFCINRIEVRRFMPTPDQFPLFFQLVDAAKKHYVSLPRGQRDSLKYLPFHYFGRAWVLRVVFVRACQPGERYLTIRTGDSKIILVTVPVQVVEAWNLP